MIRLSFLLTMAPKLVFALPKILLRNVFFSKSKAQELEYTPALLETDFRVPTILLKKLIVFVRP